MDVLHVGPPLIERAEEGLQEPFLGLWSLLARLSHIEPTVRNELLLRQWAVAKRSNLPGFVLANRVSDLRKGSEPAILFDLPALWSAGLQVGS
jgi:hypothetical protein